MDDEAPSAATVRAYRPSDRAAVERICVETGDAGRDATHLHADPRELTDRWATPYLLLDPGHAFVAERDGRVVGYVLGTADTRAFARAFATGRWPDAVPDTVLDGVPDAVPGAVPGVLLDARARREHADQLIVEECDSHPAHLHIDLGEGARGGGLGRRLIERFVDSLPPGAGVHVVVDPGNAGALAFYPRVGFARSRATPDGVVFVRPPAEPTAGPTADRISSRRRRRD